MKKLKYILILAFFVTFFYSPPSSFALFKASKYLEGTIIVPENNFCLNHNADTLSDCMLLMDQYSNNTSTAITRIKAKTTPDFSKIAPEISYRESGFALDTTTHTTDTSFQVADSYTFDRTTGKFSLVNPYSTVIDSNETSYINKYACFDGNNTSNCEYVYSIFSEEYVNNQYNVTSTMKESGIVYEVFDTDNGLYFAQDDLGDSFYYRGSVKNNYVYYAGLFWRIVRRNGDGTVRLMYYNTSLNNGGHPFDYRINSEYTDPTYVGWMYNDDDFSTTEIESSDAIFNNFESRSNYYFGKSYTYDSNDKLFYLTGTEQSGDVLHTDWKTHYNDILDGNYIYSCFSNNPLSSGCPVLIKILSRRSSSEINAHYLSYSSTSYNNAVTNDKSADIISMLNNWYDTYIAGEVDNQNNPYSDYVADGVYCNDRSLSSEQGNGNGYSLVPSTLYGAWNRIINTKLPILTCPNANDRFVLQNSTISSSAKELTRPIGLLTADEVVMAGGAYDVYNTRFYMYYGENGYTWTSSPSFFSSWSRIASLWTMNKHGSLTNWYNVRDTGIIRPVINIKSNVIIYGGDGTVNNPYDLGLPS